MNKLPPGLPGVTYTTTMLTEFNNQVDQPFPDNAIKGIAPDNVRDGFKQLGETLYTDVSLRSAGWLPVWASITDGVRLVRRLVGWQGGQGNTPTVGVGLYEGAAGLVSNIALAVDYRGAAGVKYRGAWLANTPYGIADLVTNGGNTYIRLTDGVSGASFSGVGVNWGLFAQGGGVSNGSVSRSALDPTLSNLISTQVDNAAWGYTITDANNRVVFGIKMDGTVWLNLDGNLINTSQLVDGGVTYAKLSQAVKDSFATPIDTNSTGWAWALTDATGKIALGIRLDGTVYASGITSLNDGSVTYQKLDGTGKTLLPWYAKKCLCIGDSVTAALGYQSTLAERTGMTVSTHAKPGIGLVSMVDGDGAATDPIAALTAAQLADKDVVTIFGSLNDRTSLVGTRADMYPGQNTICGKLNYVIQKVFSLAASVNRKDIRIVLVAPHKVGKYNYNDMTGGQEYPVGSGQTQESIVNAIRDIGGFNGLPVVDLYHNSGINDYTWDILTVNTTSASGPFPNNPDNVHPNAPGHARIGRQIASVINRL